jgi:uncharacterized protein YbjT (DUF2867 family)
MSEIERPVVLVTGATGNVGRPLVSQLLASGVRVRALTRAPEAAGLPRKAEVVQGDLSMPDTIEAHLDGVAAVFLVWRLPTVRGISALLDRFSARARRLVFLSSSAVRDGVDQQPNPIAHFHAELEDLIAQSGMEWTFVRPGGFATNAIWSWSPQIRAGDVVRWPYGDAAFPPIHERDIAAVAARALIEDGHAGAKYVLTGPQSLTQRQQVAAIGEAIRRPLRFEELPPDEAREEMLRLMPPVIVDVLLDAWAGLAVHPAVATTAVEEITGQPARTFRQWASDHAADFQPIATREYTPAQSAASGSEALGRGAPR